MRSLWLTSATWLQPIIHFTDIMHALGTAITPLIAQPFIVSYTRHDTAQKLNVTSAEWKAVGHDSLTQPTVHTVYTLVGAIDVVVAFICLITSSLFPADVVPLTSSQVCEGQTGSASQGTTTNFAGWSEELAQSSRANSSNHRKAVLLLVATLLFVVNGGRDALLNTLLFTYTDEYLGWTLMTSTLLVTMYHMTRVVVHAVLIPLSRWVTSTWLMTFNVVTLVISSALMLAALVDSEGLTLTIIGVIITGLATSNIHQTTISLVDQTEHIMAPVMAVFIVAIGVGQIVMAPLTGQLLESAGVVSFPAMLLVLALAGLALFCVYCGLNGEPRRYRTLSVSYSQSQNRKARRNVDIDQWCAFSDPWMRKI